jgi:hypothetical protein
METRSFQVFIEMFEILIVIHILHHTQQFYYIQQCYMFRSTRPPSSMDVHNLKQSKIPEDDL